MGMHGSHSMFLAEYVEAFSACELLAFLLSECDCYCLEVPEVFHQLVRGELAKLCNMCGWVIGLWRVGQGLFEYTINKLHIVWV